MTNNSSRSREDYVDKLQRLGIEVGTEDIYTSGDATIDYLREETKHKNIFLLGTPSLQAAFYNAGFILTDDADCVVMGYDKSLTFERLNHAYHLLVEGKPFIVTHPDMVCPAPGGTFDIDAGAMMQALIAATGVEPKVIGKPQPTMMAPLLRQLTFDKDQMAIMGDRLYTDIRAGASSGILTILVLTGEATEKDVETSAVKPDYVLARSIDLLDFR